VANTAPVIRKRVAQLLDEADINRATLARWAGVSPQHITAVMNGTRSLGKKAIDKLSESSGKPVLWFYGDDGSDLGRHPISGKTTPSTKGGADGSPAPDARVLKRRIAELEQLNEDLVRTLEDVAIIAGQIVNRVRKT
jgi:hypothetical protein